MCKACKDDQLGEWFYDIIQSKVKSNFKKING